jgi:transposase
MFGLHSQQRFLLYSQATDMRKSFDGLAGLVRNELGQEPQNGTVYLFINKRRDRLKLLHGSASGFTLYYKRLESGTFELPQYDDNTTTLKLNYAQLVLLVDGLTITNIQRRKGRRNTP